MKMVSYSPVETNKQRNYPPIYNKAKIQQNWANIYMEI